jgi:serine/threonine protein kinase
MILSKQVRVDSHQIPNGWSEEAADFINRLLKRSPEQRIGAYYGVSELKKHDWFKGYDWQAIREKSFRSPITIDVPSSDPD